MQQSKKKSLQIAQVDKENVAPAQPWNGVDPWGGYNKFSADSQDVPMTGALTGVPKQQVIEAALTKRLEEGVKADHEQRFQRLESGLTELQHQNGKFEQWFQEAGAAQQKVQHQVRNLAAQVTKNQADMETMSSKLDTGFATITAMLSKKQRTDHE